jgi:hypothetical protein
MGPSQPSRRVTRDRVRGIAFGRADHSQLSKLRALPETRRSGTSEAPSAEIVGAALPKRDRATRVFLICLIAAVAVNFGAVLGLMGSNLVPEVLRSFGLADAPPLEAMQRKQAVATAQLNATVDALNAAVAGLTARVDFSGEREEAMRTRMADIDEALVSLRTSTNEIRAAQSAASEEPWRKPLAELAAAVAKARGDITGLRTSLDETARTRQPTETAAIGARIDRLEQAMVLHNLVGPIRGSIQETRSARGGGGTTIVDGHIIDLVPAAR